MSLSLLINCGFARVAIKQSSVLKNGQSRARIDVKKRREDVQEMFEGIQGFVKDSEFWDDTNKSPWNKGCNYVLDCFSKRWNPNHSVRSDCIELFSSDNWRALPMGERESHSLSNYRACAMNLQLKFPGLPCYKPHVQFNLSDLNNVSERNATRSVLRELNNVYETELNTSFTYSLLKHCCDEGIRKKESKNERKAKERIIKRKLCKSISQEIASNAAINFLSEGESYSGY